MIEIKCINKEPRYNIYESLTHIGGLKNDGSKWKITQKEAIDYIKSGTLQFYVHIRGNRVNVIVSVSRYGHEYIKTEADGDEPNNLLSLPECK